MKKPMLFLCLLGIFQTLFAQNQETVLHVRIWLDGKSMHELEAAGVDMDHGFYDTGRSFRSEFFASEVEQAHKAGFRIDTLDTDVVATYLRENAKRKPVRTRVSDRGAGACADYGGSGSATPANYTYGSMGGFYTYEEYLAVLDDMRAKFPHLISAREVVSTNLLTHEGRPQWFVRISDQPDSEDPGEPECLYTAIHHAREPNSLSHLIYFMWFLLENYESDPELRYLLNHTELYFIPCLNPDGYIYNQLNNPAGGGFWRKNRRDNGDGTYGVDLNRNYSYGWGQWGGSSPLTDSETYRGPAPFSEPETQMVKTFIETHQFEIALNCHTSGNKMVHPWGFANVVPSTDISTLAAWLTRNSNYPSGNCFQMLGYYSDGTSDDWWFSELDKLAYTPETGLSFWPTIDLIDGNNKSMLTTNLSAAWYALGGAVIRQLPGASFSGNTLVQPFKIKQYELDTASVQVSFEALTPNILGFSTVQAMTITDFEPVSFTTVVSLGNNLQQGEIIRFVAKTERDGTVHSDTVETLFNAGSFVPYYTENNETPNAQWVFGGWGQTDEQAYSPSKSMTDSPNAAYTAEENALTTALPLTIPANADEARLRFYARWDIEPDLDWGQVLVSVNGGASFTPLAGVLTQESPVSFEPMYDGSHLYWEEECMDLSAYIGQPLLLRFALTAYSGNFNGRDGFYFDDLIIEYQTQGGVYTIDLPEAWEVQCRPNPADETVLLTWVIAADAQLEVVASNGKLLYTESADQATSHRIETANWPDGMYFYRMTSAQGSSVWKKLTVVHNRR
ncbi:MAG: immune inhibitor A [Saprospiraceae bacterium]|nr:immune inhibitor A [Saprospiraceae bacterium]